MVAVSARQLLGAVGIAVALLMPATAAGNTIVPDTRADESGHDPDNGNCTLREAIESADRDISEDACRRGNGADVIKLGRGTYQLSVPGVEPIGSTEIDNRVGDLDVGLWDGGPLRIVGHRRGSTLDGNDHDRVLQVFDTRLTLERLTITDGDAVNGGGGVSFATGAVGRLLRTKIAGNVAADAGGGVGIFPGAKATFTRGSVNRNITEGGGGGVHVFGEAVFEGTKLIRNEAGFGGGIAVLPEAIARLRRATLDRNQATVFAGGINVQTDALLQASRTTISRNTTAGAGGGIRVDRGTVRLVASTLAGNRTDEAGGGLSMGSDPSFPASVRIVNSTISGNVADADGDGGAGEGGGLSLASFGSKVVISSTITRNRATRGGGILGPFVTGLGPVELKGTIVAGNTATLANPVNGPDCLFLTAESGESLGHNLIGDPNGCDGMDARPSDIFGNPGLGPLRRNGGPTQTHALRQSSRAIDKGPPDAPRRDQRGVRRDDPDIGSFERA